MLSFLLASAAITLSGALAPGPITAATLAAGTRNRHAGALVAVGHGAMEFPLIVLMAAGLGTFLESAGARAAIGLVGGVVLILMGVQLWRGLGKLDQETEAPVERHPAWTGFVVTGTNPYFYIWWATVGLTLTSRALGFGLVALGLFMTVHWLCDLAWLEVLSMAGFKGSQVFGKRAQKAVQAVCAAMLLAFGLKFVWDAGMFLRVSWPVLEWG
jgi:threonine/homoserine/homoserine lactone efflux protein